MKATSPECLTDRSLALHIQLAAGVEWDLGSLVGYREAVEGGLREEQQRSEGLGALRRLVTYRALVGP